MDAQHREQQPADAEAKDGVTSSSKSANAACKRCEARVLLMLPIYSVSRALRAFMCHYFGLFASGLAHRIHDCEVTALTPSQSTIKWQLVQTQMPLSPSIRPRGGDVLQLGR